MEIDLESDDQNQQQNTITVANFVKYIINHSSSKQPIKRADIIRELKIPQIIFTLVLEEGRKLLKDIYGLHLRDVEDSRSKSFITFSTLNLTYGKMLNLEAANDLKMLFIVLSYIFMKSGEIQEVILYNFLNKLNLNTDELIKEKYIKQLYLKRRKVDIEGRNESYILYSWGERAVLEFNKNDMLQSVANLLKKPATLFSVSHGEFTDADPQDIEML